MDIRIIGIGPLFRIHQHDIGMRPWNGTEYRDFQMKLNIRMGGRLTHVNNFRLLYSLPECCRLDKTLNDRYILL